MTETNASQKKGETRAAGAALVPAAREETPRLERTQLAPAPPEDGQRIGERRAASLIPERTLSGRALVAVIAIMTFLASLAAGSVQLIAAASAGWTGEVGQDITIRLVPEAGQDVEPDLRRIAEAARRLRGVNAAEVMSRARTEKMLEPWLGTGLSLEDLPLPRLVVIKIDRAALDLSALRADIAALVPRAEVDDHRLWLARLATMANAMVLVGLVVLGLVLLATALAVVFATRGALAGSREVIEVLHLVGAEDGFIASEFQQGFLVRGLRGGMIGAAAAIVFFALAALFSRAMVDTPGGEQIGALFGTFALGPLGYVAILAIAGVVAMLTGLVSRITVFRVLAHTD